MAGIAASRSNQRTRPDREYTTVDREPSGLALVRRIPPREPTPCFGGRPGSTHKLDLSWLAELGAGEKPGNGTHGYRHSSTSPPWPPQISSDLSTNLTLHVWPLCNLGYGRVSALVGRRDVTSDIHTPDGRTWRHRTTANRRAGTTSPLWTRTTTISYSD
ncbi:hypothetical protein Bbelb_000540 [Branchiostoma belcheri]|nr:hypothetical protein Bbelb_000540 [Branchiostoma belcheri]